MQDTLESWQLGFDFQEGEVIQTTNDYFDTSNGSLLLPACANQREVELQSALPPASQQAVAAGVLVPGQVSSQGSACAAGTIMGPAAAWHYKLEGCDTIRAARKGHIQLKIEAAERSAVILTGSCGRGRPLPQSR